MMAGLGSGFLIEPLCPMRVTPPEAPHEGADALEGLRQEHVADGCRLVRPAVLTHQQPGYGEQSHMPPVTASVWVGMRRDFDEIDQAWRLAKSKELRAHMRSLPKLTGATDEEILGFTEDGLLDP
ncbi:MAG: hypothetical protein HC888_19030 [Candidatus Competibacteraceae bacterium]|nr:hypothetical protein [Candidatus Competibacteraceae bacterium]